jgi:hypothetical protein
MFRQILLPETYEFSSLTQDSLNLRGKSKFEMLLTDVRLLNLVLLGLGLLIPKLKTTLSRNALTTEARERDFEKSRIYIFEMLVEVKA